MVDEHGSTDAEQEQNTVLIVEDDEGLADLYSVWLSERYDVRTAYDGLSALEQFDADVDVVLLDRNLPKQSGDMVLEEIRERDGDCKVTVVSAVEPELSVASMPVDDYFVKPVSRERLESAVDELILRSDVGGTRQELLALISRRITIEEESHLTNLTESPEYEQLHEKIAALEAQLSVDPDDISSAHRPDACPECDLRWDVDVDGVVGFLDIAYRVWKCRECGETVRQQDHNSRRVAKR